MWRYLTIYLILFSSYSLAYGVNQYRCNGRVQYRPCAKESPQRPSYSPLQSRKSSAKPTLFFQKKYAEVLSSTFEKVSHTQGVWKGRVQGNGDIQLLLKFLENGREVASQKVGKVTLINKSTTFRIQSGIPKGTTWSWSITAIAS